MRAGSDSSGCGGNTDGPTVFLKPAPFVRFPALLAHGRVLPFAARPAHWRTSHVFGVQVCRVKDSNCC